MLTNWYDAAIYFLHDADFLRVLDFRNIQTIVVIGSCAIHFGEFNLFRNLWPCALRIAQSIGLHRDAGHESETCAQRQLRQNVFWSVVISDWLSVPLGHTCIDDSDFSLEVPVSAEQLCHHHAQEQQQQQQSSSVVAIPPYASESAAAPFSCRLSGTATGCCNHTSTTTTTTATTTIRPGDFLVAKIKMCNVIHRFQNAAAAHVGVNNNSMSSAAQQRVETIVKDADNELANVISQLPLHLQLDEEETEETVARAQTHAWIPWQRQAITTLFLYYRMVINRTSICPGDSRYTRAAAVCLASAHGIVDTILNSTDVPLARQRTW